jgi:hypothetical protein
MAFEPRVETIEAGSKVAPPARTDASEEGATRVIVRVSAWPIRVGSTPSTETKRYVLGRTWLHPVPGLHSRTK